LAFRRIVAAYHRRLEQHREKKKVFFVAFVAFVAFVFFVARVACCR